MKPALAVSHLVLAAACLWVGIHMGRGDATVQGQAMPSADNAAKKRTHATVAEVLAQGGGDRAQADALIDTVERMELPALPAAWRACLRDESAAGDLCLALIAARFADTPEATLRKALGEAEWPAFDLLRRLHAAGDDPAAIAKALASNLGTSSMSKALRRILFHHPSTATDALLNALDSLPRTQLALDLWKSAAMDLAQQDPRRAIASLERLSRYDAANVISKTHLPSLIYDKDPAAFEDWMARQGRETKKQRDKIISRSSAFNACLMQDPRKAIDMLGDANSDEGYAVLGRYLATDLAGALRWIDERNASPATAFAPYTIANALASLDVWHPSDRQIDIPARLAAANALPANGCRDYALWGIIKTWAASDPEAALALALSEPQAISIQQLLSGVFKGKPSQIAEFLGRHPEYIQKCEGYGSHLNIDFIRFLRQDREGAKELFKRMPLEIQAECYDNFMQNLGTWDREGLREFVASLDSEIRPFGHRTFAQTFDNIDDAIAYAKTLPEAERRTCLGGVFFDALNRYNITPAEADRLISAEPDASERASLRSNLLFTWACQDPPAAMEHLLAHPADFEAYKPASVAHQWAEFDPGAASAWASSLPNGEKRTEIVESIFWSLAKTVPLVALELVASLPEAERIAACEDIGFRLKQGLRTEAPPDIEAVKARVKDLDIPEEVREKILQDIVK